MKVAEHLVVSILYLYDRKVVRLVLVVVKLISNGDLDEKNVIVEPVLLNVKVVVKVNMNFEVHDFKEKI